MDEAPDNRLHDQQTDAIEQLSALKASTESQILAVIRGGLRGLEGRRLCLANRVGRLALPAG